MAKEYLIDQLTSAVDGAHSPRKIKSNVFGFVSCSVQVILTCVTDKIYLFETSVCVCIYVYAPPPPRLLITGGMMWHYMDSVWFVKQVVQL